jgi:hypothetical protein
MPNTATKSAPATKTTAAKAKTAKQSAPKTEVKASVAAAPVTTDTPKSKVPKLVNQQGTLWTTQDCANAIGRNWQFVNKRRSAGKFIDTAAMLKTTGAFLYRRADLRAWAKDNGYSIAA